MLVPSKYAACAPLLFRWELVPAEPANKKVEFAAKSSEYDHVAGFRVLHLVTFCPGAGRQSVRIRPTPTETYS